ncbi:DUF3105 domain-containing protein [Hamadaea tsunoensis]|uniref:DUF3105 domain-containing protein n=1 Tax=Hamadaea tsunoensis TaxID=53368 RepID=UPI00041483C4|nr:DUF3105 domain-containing protein [Hamadaea tsunoensis]
MATRKSGARPGGGSGTKPRGPKPASGTQPQRPAGGTQQRAAAQKAVKAAAHADRPWNFTLITVAVAVLVAIAGAVWFVNAQSGKNTAATPTVTGDYVAKAQTISGIVDRHTEKFGNTHVQGKVTYDTTPPIGGNHNPIWQNCMGDVYTQPIANEHAVHSLEHGAIWITYDPSLPADQVKLLEDRVKGVPYTLLSPYPDQGSAISLQAWGWQLKVDNAGDSRIDQFINDLRVNASQETGAVCSGGNTTTGADLDHQS